MIGQIKLLLIQPSFVQSLTEKKIAMNKKILKVAGLVAIIFIGTAFTKTGDKYFEIVKNIEIFTNLYKELNTHYVDEVDPGELMSVGLKAMVSSLDPFTNYFSESDIEAYRIQSEGRYHGIGTKNKKIGDLITITELYKDQPADLAGLRAGDQIIEVDGNSAVGRSMDEMHEIMRGFPGSTMELLIRRPGENKDITIELTRGDVKIPNVPHYGMLNDGIAYINLSTFTRGAGQNIAAAYKEMKEENPELKGLVLDLRGNGGGLLNEAVNICNIFIPKDKVVVTTKGKIEERDRAFKTMNEVIDADIPLVVLINKNSASASEIVSGVMQDYDRGVLIGQRSYGKGLVQNTMDIGYNARVKITTSKYYIPSQRCIQSVAYDNGVPVHIPDNKRAQFKTQNGRLVLDGGGVKPDVLMDPIESKGFVKALIDEHLIFNYVTEWAAKHPEIDSTDVFQFTEFSDFQNYLDRHNFEYISNAEKVLSKLKTKAEEEELDLDTQITAIENTINDAQLNKLSEGKTLIIDLIEKEIAGRYYYQKGKVQVGLRNDAEIKEAINILNDELRYHSILGTK